MGQIGHLKCDMELSTDNNCDQFNCPMLMCVYEPEDSVKIQIKRRLLFNDVRALQY